jgi:hypothetical protein
MVENNPPASAECPRARVIPLPIALYVSGDLIFQRYEGGQSCRRFSIPWERLVPAKENELETGKHSSPTGMRTHQD